MNKILLLTAILSSLFLVQVYAQIRPVEKNLQFELRKLSESNTWGVFISPGSEITPSDQTRTGSGQVTIVVPIHFTYSNLQNFSGTWIQNARVDGPAEAPGKAYISFGFVMDEPKIRLMPRQETLLFTFLADGDAATEVTLFDNENDPFAAPNSFSSNPGNDFGMIDFGAGNGVCAYVFVPKPTDERPHYRTESSSRPKVILASEKSDTRSEKNNRQND